MIIAEELVGECMERYEVNRLEAITMVLEDLRVAEKDLEVLGAHEIIEGTSKAKEKGGEHHGS